MFGVAERRRGQEPLRLRRWPAQPPLVARETGGAYALGAATPTCRPSLAEALRQLDDALDVLAAVDVDHAHDRALLDGVEEAERLLSRATAQQLRLLGAVQRRESYTAVGAGTCASWYRNAVRSTHGEATRRVQAAVRLPALPQLASALACGNVTPSHALAITTAAVPSRMDAIASHESTLVDLALAASPRELGVALRRIADHADADGSDPDRDRVIDGCTPDPRRELSVRAMFDGLGELIGTLGQVETELLLVLLDAYENPDPPGTPPSQLRSAGQRRADAFGALLRAVADAGVAPTENGIRPHLLLGVDLASLLGIDPADPSAERLAEALARLLADAKQADLARLFETLVGHEGGTVDGPCDSDNDATAPAQPEPAAAADAAKGSDVGPTAGCRPGDASGSGSVGEPDVSGCPDPSDAGRGSPVDVSDLLHPDPAAAARQPRLRRTGPIDVGLACHLALDARVTCVLTMGPWRVVNVGRTMRTLPTWLRPILELRHRHCRGPDCDRPAAWTEAHHVQAWTAEHGDTDLNRTVPVCKAHHDMVTNGSWSVDYDPGTGVCTWISRDGTIRHTRVTSEPVPVRPGRHRVR